MSLLVHQIPLSPGQPDEAAFAAARQKLHLGANDVAAAAVYQRSVDARHRPNIRLVVSVCLTLTDAALEKQLVEKKLAAGMISGQLPPMPQGEKPLTHPPVVVGFGPAGMFCALLLARMGYRPIVLERGCAVEGRTKRVDTYWQNGQLDENTNVQFGEGGAGTFSDGKLVTRISDPFCRFVLEQFARFGAPAEILQKAKPHVGTDHLTACVRALRREVERLGGEIRFQTTFTGIQTKSGSLTGITTTKGEIPCECLFLGPGHSARDTFSALAPLLTMTPKPFSVGVRVEQRQSIINAALYGDPALAKLLGPGEYALSHRTNQGCVYTFCMCPGGVVTPSASASGQVVTNGMSRFARDGENANSALVVAVDGKDFGNELMDGMHFQQRLEEAAFAAGGRNGKAPISTADRFLRQTLGIDGTTGQAGKSSGLSIGDAGCAVTPSYAIGVTETDLHPLFPPRIHEQLALGLQVFERKVHGFGAADTLLTGVETRTSSPLRICRKDDGQSLSVSGIYPMGEGAGYAGGIVSAAVDGLHAAQHAMALFAPLD